MTVGYDNYLLPEGSDAGIIVTAFGNAIAIKEEGSWDKRVWVQDTQREIGFKLVSDLNPSLPGNQSAEVAKVVELAQANLTLTNEVAKLKKIVADLGK